MALFLKAVGWVQPCGLNLCFRPRKTNQRCFKAWEEIYLPKRSIQFSNIESRKAVSSPFFKKTRKITSWNFFLVFFFLIRPCFPRGINNFDLLSSQKHKNHFEAKFFLQLKKKKRTINKRITTT